MKSQQRSTAFSSALPSRFALSLLVLAMHTAHAASSATNRAAAPAATGQDLQDNGLKTQCDLAMTRT